MSAACPRLWSVGTASPPHVLPQADARAFARGFFAEDFPHIDRLLRAFDNTGIARRQMACPIAWYEQEHTFTEKNEIYRRVALELSQASAERALARADVEREDIAAVVMVSTTGICTPSLDSFVIQLLDLPRSVARVPLWGLGCAGGAAGVARAADLARSLQKPVLLIAVELCSTTFMHDDRSKSNLIATALFGDGAAAAVIGPGGEGPALLGGHSHLMDDSEDVMGWELRERGLQVRFARSIPGIVADIVPEFVKQAARQARIDPASFHHFVLHPGGTKVLHAYEEALRVPRARIQASYDVIREHGNMSSPTVLFVLERFLEETPPVGAHGLLLGLGPGFSAEGVTFRW